MVGDLGWPLERAVRLHGEATAVIDGERSVTYAELGRRVAGLGAAIGGELGVAPAGRVGVLAFNSLAHLECWLAIPAAGRVIADLNVRLALDELAFMVDDAGIEVLVVDDAHLETGHALLERCDALRAVVTETEPLTEAPPDPPRADLAEDTLAAISYTGGTTGRAKGVMLSHGNLLANARHNLQATGHRSSDRWLHVCPMFHVAGTANVLAATWVGATQVILPRFDARAVAETIDAHEITHVVLVPTMLAMLLDELRERPAPLASLRHIQYAASPISPELQRRVLERFDCDVAQFYGMTEAAPTVTHCTPADHRAGGERLRSMGAPVAGVRAVVRDAEGRELPPGEVGEVWVRGPNVMLGYWNRPEATAEALAGGWYRTGDAAHADGDGYLYMVDRLKDMIISGGENVYSIEVEAVLAEHPAVVEAAVYGVPDERWGEAVHAAVVADAPVSAEELAAHCRERIAGFKVPRSIELRDEPLPKSGAGKVLKSQLRSRTSRATPP